MVPIFDLDEGACAIIAEVSLPLKSANDELSFKRHCQERSRMSALGMRKGKKIQLLRKQGTGPLLVKVDELKFALCRRLAMQIKVN